MRHRNVNQKSLSDFVNFYFWIKENLAIYGPNMEPVCQCIQRGLILKVVHEYSWKSKDIEVESSMTENRFITI